MKHFLLLARIFRKCGKGNENKDAGSELKGNDSSLWAVLAAIALPVLFFFFGRFLGPFVSMMGGVESLMSTFFLLGASVTFFLAIAELISSLFLSSDVQYLLSLPFSARQIVLARTLNAALTKMLFLGLATLGFGIGLALTATEQLLTVPYVLGLILGTVTTTVIAVCTAAIVVILIMTVFRIARSRETVAVAGAIAGFLLLVGYTFLRTDSNSLNAEHVRETVDTVVSTMNRFSAIVPVVPFVTRFMAGKDMPLNLLIILAITAVFVLLYLFVSDKLYLRSALNILDSASGKKALDRSALGKACRKRSPERACMLKDIRCVLRNPAYMTNGWLMSLAWPLLVLGAFVFGSGMDFGALLDSSQEGADMMMRLYQCSGAIAVGLLAACSASGLSCLSSTIISREGSSFGYMKMMPVSYARQVVAKRNVALVIGAIGSIGYEFLAGIVLLILGIEPALWTLYCMLLTAALLLICVNMQAQHGMKKPNLNWDSESVIAKSNGLGVLIFVVGLILAMLLFLLLPAFLMVLVAINNQNAEPAIVLFALALLVLNTIFAVISEIRLRKKAESRLDALDA